jgi:hypothetical protein
MEMSPGFQFDVGDRVQARTGHYGGKVGTILSRRRGFGTPAYIVDFGQGSCLIVKQEELAVPGQRASDIESGQ